MLPDCSLEQVFRVEKEGTKVDIEDEGISPIPTEIGGVAGAKDPLVESGRGNAITRELCDDVSIDHVDGSGSRLRLGVAFDLVQKVV